MVTYKTTNFDSDHFKCKSEPPVPVPAHLMSNLKELMDNLQVLRDYVKSAIIVNSGYRTPEHNRKINGKPNSQHLLAKAADIRSNVYTPQQLGNIIEELISQGKMKQGGLKVYNTFVHYDVRGHKARW